MQQIYPNRKIIAKHMTIENIIYCDMQLSMQLLIKLMQSSVFNNFLLFSGIWSQLMQQFDHKDMTNFINTFGPYTLAITFEQYIRTVFELEDPIMKQKYEQQQLTHYLVIYNTFDKTIQAL